MGNHYWRYSEMEELKERELMPSFRLHSVQGEVIGPGDYRGHKNVLLVLFDINCEECGQFLEDAAERYEDYTDNDAEILVVGNTSETDLRDIVEGLHLPFPVLSDPEGIVLNQYTNGIPTLIVLDRYGEIKMIQRLADGKHLPDQDTILSRIELNELECPECGVTTWPM
jgi:peroxiredoxin